MPKAAVRKTPADQLQPVPEIVGSGWIRARYQISQRTIERYLLEGTLKPFRPANNFRGNRFYAKAVLLALEGPHAIKGREFVPVVASDGDE